MRASRGPLRSSLALMQRCEDTDDDCHQVGFTPFVQCRSREGGILHTTSVSLPLWTDNNYLIFVLFLSAGYSFDYRLAERHCDHGIDGADGHGRGPQCGANPHVVKALAGSSPLVEAAVLLELASEPCCRGPLTAT